MVLILGLIAGIPILIYFLWKDAKYYRDQLHRKWMRFPDVKDYLQQ